MTMTEASPKEWEIWHAKFWFDDKKAYKFRPVLTLACQGDQFAAAMITSAHNKLSLPHDYVLADWRSEGLNKPSLVRLDRIAQLTGGDLGRGGKFGSLSLRDRLHIAAILDTLG